MVIFEYGAILQTTCGSDGHIPVNYDSWQSGR